jgi:hypothetical protein
MGVSYKPVDHMRESFKTRSLLNGESKVSGHKYKLPKYARLVHKVHGIDVNGDVITVVVLACLDGKRKREELYIIQYREVKRIIDRSSRRVRQFSGFDARLRMEVAMSDISGLLEGSRIIAAAEGNPSWQEVC